MTDIIREATAIDVIAGLHGATVLDATYTITAKDRAHAKETAEALHEVFGGEVGHLRYDHRLGGAYSVDLSGRGRLANIRYTDEEPAKTCATCGRMDGNVQLDPLCDTCTDVDCWVPKVGEVA